MLDSIDKTIVAVMNGDIIDECDDSTGISVPNDNTHFAETQQTQNNELQDALNGILDNLIGEQNRWTISLYLPMRQCGHRSRQSTSSLNETETRTVDSSDDRHHLLGKRRKISLGSSDKGNEQLYPVAKRSHSKPEKHVKFDDPVPHFIISPITSPFCKSSNQSRFQASLEDEISSYDQSFAEQIPSESEIETATTSTSECISSLSTDELRFVDELQRECFSDAILDVQRLLTSAAQLHSSSIENHDECAMDNANQKMQQADQMTEEEIRNDLKHDAVDNAQECYQDIPAEHSYFYESYSPCSEAGTKLDSGLDANGIEISYQSELENNGAVRELNGNIGEEQKKGASSVSNRADDELQNASESEQRHSIVSAEKLISDSVKKRDGTLEELKVHENSVSNLRSSNGMQTEQQNGSNVEANHSKQSCDSHENVKRKSEMEQTNSCLDAVNKGAMKVYDDNSRESEEDSTIFLICHTDEVHHPHGVYAEQSHNNEPLRPSLTFYETKFTTSVNDTTSQAILISPRQLNSADTGSQQSSAQISLPLVMKSSDVNHQVTNEPPIQGLAEISSQRTSLLSSVSDTSYRTSEISSLTDALSSTSSDREAFVVPQPDDNNNNVNVNKQTTPYLSVKERIAIREEQIQQSMKPKPLILNSSARIRHRTFSLDSSLINDTQRPQTSESISEPSKSTDELECGRLSVHEMILLHERQLHAIEDQSKQRAPHRSNTQ
ncbi:unnamed protein product [Anisakis simplex]|uniref:FYVE-type domain-containing protein n=1 Tax=Anisakis simplex TaxID=6269 RepID=A0A0M3K8N8_ANISI|nr:unnamed protein product [Anisakis simplex]